MKYFVALVSIVAIPVILFGMLSIGTSAPNDPVPKKIPVTVDWSYILKIEKENNDLKAVNGVLNARANHLEERQRTMSHAIVNMRLEEFQVQSLGRQGFITSKASGLKIAVFFDNLVKAPESPFFVNAKVERLELQKDGSWQAQLTQLPE